MTTLKLLWGMTWRGGVWGLTAGGLLVTLYSAIIFTTLFLLDAILALFDSDLAGVVFDLMSIPIWAIPTMFIGFIFGVPLGLTVGSIIGATRVFLRACSSIR